MRNLTSSETAKLKKLTENSISLTLIEPTENGLNKSIMDATGPVRLYLKENGVHDYQQQDQGPANKILVRSFLVKNTLLLPSTASLYRPVTKKGDPRIWFKGLGDYSKPNDILGIISFDSGLYVINITRMDVEALLAPGATNPLKDLVNAIRASSNAIAEELLGLIRKLTKDKRPIKAVGTGDTAIGRTIETALGIKINSSKKPDYKGIELKSYRDKKGNRKNLFAQVPDWPVSKFQSSAQILSYFGYQRGADFKLYCTVSTKAPNSQGLQLRVDNRLSWLIEHSDRPEIGDFVVWTLENLHKRLLEKHSETFWIAADEVPIDGQPHFIYKSVEHTQKPIVSQFDILLEQGIITLDHLIKKTPDGRVVEKGPLFKIKPNSLGLLFPPSSSYNLY